jgi:arylsulfatase A-like enzyme
VSSAALLKRCGGIIACLGLFATTLVSCSQRSRNDVSVAKQPNIVFLLTDDLDNTTMPYWQAMPKTRKLIADRGLQFVNNFAPAPVCCPARAAILTGKYPHNNGIFDASGTDGGYDTFARNGQERDTLATRLRAAGYTTSFMGKYLNGYEAHPRAVPPGWDDWFGLAGPKYLAGFGYSANVNGKLVKYGNRPRDYETDVLTRRADDFISGTERHDSKPFLLFLAPTAPHDPIGPAPRDKHSKWSKAVLPRRPNFNEADVSDKPTWLRDGVREQSAADVASLTKRYRDKMGSLLALDDMVASVFAQLKKNSELDHTVVMFASDNGNNFGAHRLKDKQVPYEESIRVPFAITGPGIRRGVEKSFVTHLDYEPTMLDLAGVRVPDTLDGRSLLPLLRREGPPLHGDFLMEMSGTYAPLYRVDTFADVRNVTKGGPNMLGPPTFRAVRDANWLYVQWYGGQEHEYELYDVHEDPYELNNLLAEEGGRERYSDVVTRLQERLDALAKCSGRSCG